MQLQKSNMAGINLPLVEAALGAGVWKYDLQTHEMAWSTGFFRIVGLDPNSIIPTPELYDSLLHPDDRIAPVEYFQKANAGELPVRRYRLIRPDGRLLWLSCKTERQFDREGRLVVLLGVVQDVTADEVARSEQSRLASFNTSARKITGADFWRADPQGKLIDLKGWMQFTGQNADQLRDYGSLSAVHPDDRERFRQAWQDGIARKQRIDLTVRVRHHSGTYQRFKNVAVPMTDDGGAILEWHGMTVAVDDTPSTSVATAAIQAAHIRAARALLDISAQQLAEMSQVSFSTLRRMESDASAVRQDSVEQVRAALELRGVQFLPRLNGQVSVGLAAV